MKRFASAVSLDLPRKKKFSYEKAFAYTCVAIPLIGFLLFSLFPLAISFISMFNSMEYYDLESMSWNSFENFKVVLSDATFYKSIAVTLLLACSQFISLFIALFISLLLRTTRTGRKIFAIIFFHPYISFLLSKKPKGRKIFQIIFFIPYICSSVATAYMWMTMFDPNYGIINSFLVSLFGEGARVSWTSDPVAYVAAIMITTIWQAPGYGVGMDRGSFEAVNPSL